MKRKAPLIAALLGPGLALAAWLLGGAALLRLTLEPAERVAIDGALMPLLESRGMLVVLWWLVAAAFAAWLVHRLYERFVAQPARLADATRVLASDAAAPELREPQGWPADELARAINALGRERKALQLHLGARIAQASANIAVERDRLGALMAELNQSVVVCNRDGRVLLYNARARKLFRSLSDTGPAAGGAELVGLGRSIYAVVDRALIAHALESLERRILRAGRADNVSTRFVTGIGTGHLLQVSMAAVRATGQDAAQTAEQAAPVLAPEHGAPAVNGYVLLFDDITDEYRTQSLRDRQMLELTESSRASLASMQAALDMLEYPDLDDETRQRFDKVVRDEVATMSARLAALAASTSQDMMTRWPLQEILGADLLAAAARRIEGECKRPVALVDVDESLWLKVDSFALIQALVFLSSRLIDEFDLRTLRLRLSRAGARAHLDLLWSGRAASTETVMGWQISPMQTADTRTPLSVRDVVERHGGEIWFERDRALQVAFFRFLLPTANVDDDEPTSLDSRPEYYDFDLFAVTPGSELLDERSLAELSYTVFDTETTGLDPAGGDEIIQLGATRIVNGKLLRGECFDQLVDPGRDIPEASIPIHGIHPEMVRGKPRIEQALVAFHAFARETVLVGHNAAFDMRFIGLKRESSGVHFDQPVLDTLLLASVVHPNETGHGLEVIAERLGVQVAGRHTAIGDALTTAEVFLKLLPLLQERGIHTLGEARDAAQQSYYARLKY